MGVNKVVYGSDVIIDLTADTVAQSTVLSGATFHGADGEVKTGTCDYDINSQGATIAVAEMLEGKTAAVRGAMVTGTMPNNGAVTGSISTKNGSYSIPQGYHDGSGKVTIANTDQIVAGNIKSGIEILGVTGTYTGAAISAQSKSVTPSTSAQSVLPDSGYDYLSQVTVAAIPYAESANSAGGTTVTIAG